MSESAATEPRGWVRRLGSYLFIFGGRGDAGQPEHSAYIDRLAVMAQEREAKHGADVRAATEPRPWDDTEWGDDKDGD